MPASLIWEVNDCGKVNGTGPYIVQELETDKGLTLVKMKITERYNPHLIYDLCKNDHRRGHQATMAMQSGELMPLTDCHASLPLFEKRTDTRFPFETSRSFCADEMARQKHFRMITSGQRSRRILTRKNFTQ